MQLFLYNSNFEFKIKFEEVKNMFLFIPIFLFTGSLKSMLAAPAFDTERSESLRSIATQWEADQHLLALQARDLQTSSHKEFADATTNTEQDKIPAHIAELMEDLQQLESLTGDLREAIPQGSAISTTSWRTAPEGTPTELKDLSGASSTTPGNDSEDDDDFCVVTPGSSEDNG